MGERKGKGKKGKDGAAKLGRTSWVKGDMLKFYESRGAEYRLAVEAGPQVTGRFYDKMTRLTILRWGWDLQQSLATDSKPTDEAAMQMSVADDDATVEQTNRRKETFDALKARLGNWFRHHFRNVDSNKNATGIVKEILVSMRDVSTQSKGEKMTAQKLFRQEKWETELKSEFETHWKGLQDAGAPDKDRLKQCNIFTKAKFREQPEDYIAKLTEEAARLNKVNDEGIMHKITGPATAVEFQRAMAEAGSVLYPLANASAKHLGAIVVIMCCGVNSQGKIEVHTAQSSMDGGCVPQLWPEWDPDRFTETERSLQGYGHAFFSREDCRARIIENLEDAEINESTDLIELSEDEADKTEHFSMELTPVSDDEADRSSDAPIPSSEPTPVPDAPIPSSDASPAPDAPTPAPDVPTPAPDAPTPSSEPITASDAPAPASDASIPSSEVTPAPDAPTPAPDMPTPARDVPD
ncbi:hypothetical protein H0H92_006944, partial [Tricholoma furcatifolium]